MQREIIEGQISVIEKIHGVTILNRDEVVSWILEAAGDEMQALTCATALNTWIAMRDLPGRISIPHAILEPLLSRLAAREGEGG